MSEVQGDYVAEQPLEGGPPPPQEPPPQEKVSQPEVEAPKPRIEQKRQEIYDRIRQRREWELSEARKDAGQESEPVPQQEPSQQETQQQEPKTQTETPAERRFRLRVNHQDRELTEQEMIAAAQQHLAAEDALPEVKRLRAELMNTLAQLKNSGNLQPQGQPAHQPTGPSEQADTKPQQLDLRKVVSEIQLGDEDTGTEALESLVEDIERRILAKQGSFKSSDEITRDAMAGMKSELLANALTSEFQSRHPEIYQDRRLGAATVITLNDLCLQEMRNIGVAEEHLQAVQREPQRIADWHRQYRERGFPVSDPLTLADAAANHVKGDLLRLLSPQPQAGGQQPQPQPQPQVPMQPNGRSQARVEEKRAEQSNNPRRANTVQRVTPQAPKSTADIVADMRARRKFAI